MAATKAAAVTSDATSRARDAMSDAVDSLSDAVDHLNDALAHAGDSASEAVDSARESISDAVASAADTAAEAHAEFDERTERPSWQYAAAALLAITGLVLLVRALRRRREDDRPQDLSDITEVETSDEIGYESTPDSVAGWEMPDEALSGNDG